MQSLEDNVVIRAGHNDEDAKSVMDLVFVRGNNALSDFAVE